MKYESQDDFKNEIDALRETLGPEADFVMGEEDSKLRVDFELPYSSMPQVCPPGWDN